MKYNFNKSSSDPTKTEDSEEVRSREISVARDMFETLLTTTIESVGFPREDFSESALQEGVILTQQFLKITNPQTRRLIVELVEIIAVLNTGH